MHEVGIARGILDAVAQRFPERETVQEVTVRLGPFCGVEPEALRFAFEVLRSELLTDRVRLVLDLPPATGDCESCGRGIPLPSARPTCPHCSKTLAAVHGDGEMTLVAVGVTDEETTHAGI